METISKINAVQSLWKAAPHMPFEGLPRSELLRKTGGVVPTFKIHAKNAHVAAMRQYAPVKAVNDLPNSYDWRNVEGKNYVSPVRNQQSCGSCYIFGTEGMFEARIRVATKNATQSIFSPQEVVSCDSLYSQGCNGGFPYLIEKYAQDFGIVEESCYPYHGSDSQCKPTSCKRQYFTNYGYVGGYYGASTEQGMMEEIYKNGPIVVNFEVLSDFYYYRSGIYKHTKLGNDPEPFVTVNHSVLIVGWGEQAGTKYWIVKNSWGSGWGMNG
jgi:cathepsin C